MRIRLGVVGLGEGWERRHKPALLRLSDKFEIRALYDEVAHRAAVQAAELECDAAGGFTALIERPDIDAVYFLGNSWSGVAPIQTACRVKKAIYHARRINGDCQAAQETIDNIRSSDVRFMAEFPWRFYPATIRLMELLASGLGSPQLVFCDQSVLVPEKPAAASRGEPDAEDVTLYTADWMRFVFARNPTAVQSASATPSDAGPCLGCETIVAEFGDSCLAHAMIRRYPQPTWSEAGQFGRPPSFHVVAEHGMAFVQMPSDVTWFDKSGRHDETLEMERSLGEMLSDRFYRIVVHGLTPSPGLDDLDWARRIVTHARAASAAGRRQTFSV
jgi:predicted dehydrogenase